VADKFLPVRSTDEAGDATDGAVKRLVDQGDGTWAELVVVAGDDGGNTVGIAQGGNEATVADANPDQAAYAVVVREVRQGNFVDHSAVIAAGGTAQNALGANWARRALILENPKTATEDLWHSFVGAAGVAAQGSRCLSPGDSFEVDGLFVSEQALSVIAATTGHVFTCWEG
jgi:hypothetical protein